MAILLLVESRKRLTFTAISVRMHITMAEVAVFISTALGLANCQGRKGETAEGCNRCQAMHAGTVQNMCRTAIRLDGAQIRGMQ